MLDLEISVDGLSAQLAQAGKDGRNLPVVLLDVREPCEYAIGHLEGSLAMPMGDVPSRAHQELDPDAHIVTICHHGVRSLHVAQWLRQQGFERAQSLAGGIDHWSRVIDPKIPIY